MSAPDKCAAYPQGNSPERSQEYLLDPLGERAKELAKRNASLLYAQTKDVKVVARFMNLPESRVKELLEQPEG